MCRKNKGKQWLLASILLAGSQLITVGARSQERFWLYPDDRKAVIAGFDSLPPFIDYYPAPNGLSGRTAILICPGGGYGHLAWEKEGTVPARIFNEAGIDAFVLRYRLNNARQEGHRYPDQYKDVTTALRLIRSKAAQLHYDPEKVGIMGFSAGGHLASMATTLPKAASTTVKDSLERCSSRPAFAVLVYPVIDMSDTMVTHRGSRTNLLGRNPSAALADSLSTQKRVSPQTPPVMLVLADDDKAVIPQNSIGFYQALKQNKVPATMHIFDHGGHGFGTAPNDPVLRQWPRLTLAWMARLGFK